VRRELADNGYISEPDLGLLTVTDDVDAAVREVTGFFANYQSQRFVDGRLVLRVRAAPDDATLSALSAEFGDIIRRGQLERVDASAVEIDDDDGVELARVAFWFDKRGWSRLRTLIDRLNEVAPS